MLTVGALQVGCASTKQLCHEEFALLREQYTQAMSQQAPEPKGVYNRNMPSDELCFKHVDFASLLPPLDETRSGRLFDRARRRPYLADEVLGNLAEQTIELRDLFRDIDFGPGKVDINRVRLHEVGITYIIYH